ncbi:MAG: HNH endonuclease [Acidiferrobacteraceae bacterium]
MTSKRRRPPIDVRQLVLHEAGFRCANPTCRTLLTIEIHHLEPVSEGGPNTPDNLLPLCPNCHSLHHEGHIPIESLKAWKLLLLSLNEGVDQRAVDILLTLDQPNMNGALCVSGDGILQCAGLISSGLIVITVQVTHMAGAYGGSYMIRLSPKGRIFIDGWKNGNQMEALGGVAVRREE